MLRSLVGPLFFKNRQRTGLVDLGIELVDDGLWRAGRGHDAEPDGGLVAWQAGLRDGRHVRQYGGARLPGRAERTHLPVLGRGGHGGDGIDHHLYVPTDDAGACITTATMRDM